MYVCSLFGRLFHTIFSNTKMLDLLRANPVAGNLILTSLVVVTGVSMLKDAIEEDNISANQICNAASADIQNRLNIESLEITGRLAKSALSVDGDGELENNKLAFCIYEIEKAFGSERKNFDITHRVLEEELTSNIKEVKITKTNLRNICKDERTYENKPAVNFTPTDIELFLLSSADNVYPAFRWRCRYFPPTQPEPFSSEPDEQADPAPVEIGINLDNFCQQEYGDKGLAKAAFHHYDDVNSWYCTNPNITADFN